MVMENFEQLISPAIAFSALIAALAGIILINSLFKDKIKDLFDDANYFFFVFLSAGYTLYALGEISWYLVMKTTDQPDANSISDIYWTTGIIVILAAFLVFAYTMHKRYGELQHRKSWIIIAISVAFATMMFLFYVNQNATQSYPFGYFYLMMSSLILIISINIILFRQKIAQLGQGFLLIFFFANVGTFIGDALFLYTTTSGTYGIAGAVSGIAYLGAYALSALAFIVIIIRFYTKGAYS